MYGFSVLERFRGSGTRQSWKPHPARNLSIGSEGVVRVLSGSYQGSYNLIALGRSTRTRDFQNQVPALTLLYPYAPK